MPTAKQLANLKPPFKKGEQREEQRKGGKKSGEVRRTIADIRKWAEQNLFTERGQDKKPLYEMLFKKLEQLSSQGNLKAIEMLMNYSGLKPIERVANTDTNGNDIVKNDLSKLDTETLLKMAEKADIDIEE